MATRLVPRSDDFVDVRLPRSALTVVDAPPEWISQLTSERTIGIPRRAFLALVGEYRKVGGEVIATGKLRLARREDLIDWMRRRAPEVSTSSAEADGDDYARSLGLVS